MKTSPDAFYKLQSDEVWSSFSLLEDVLESHFIFINLFLAHISAKGQVLLLLLAFLLAKFCYAAAFAWRDWGCSCLCLYSLLPFYIIVFLFIKSLGFSYGAFSPVTWSCPLNSIYRHPCWIEFSTFRYHWHASLGIKLLYQLEVEAGTSFRGAGSYLTVILWHLPKCFRCQRSCILLALHHYLEILDVERDVLCLHFVLIPQCISWSWLVLLK